MLVSSSPPPAVGVSGPGRAGEKSWCHRRAAPSPWGGMLDEGGAGHLHVGHTMLHAPAVPDGSVESSDGQPLPGTFPAHDTGTLCNLHPRTLAPVPQPAGGIPAPWVVRVRHLCCLGDGAFLPGETIRLAFPELSCCHGDRSSSDDTSDGRQDVVGTTRSGLVPLQRVSVAQCPEGRREVEGREDPIASVPAPPVVAPWGAGGGYGRGCEQATPRSRSHLTNEGRGWGTEGSRHPLPSFGPRLPCNYLASAS